MPTDVAARHPLAARRILRLTLGTALCLLFSQVFAWPLSFVAPVLTLVILATPLPPLPPKKALGLLVALLAPVVLGAFLLLPFLEYTRWVAVLLVALALFYSFYYTARGGNPVVGTFMTIGVTLIVTVGSVSGEIVWMLIKALAVCTVVAILFTWIAHTLLPDLPPDGTMPRMTPPQPERPPPAVAGRNALRALAVTLPMALLFLFMSGSPSYTVVMIKVATMGQQATADHSKAMATSLIESTLWGGLGAVVAWQILSIWPSLLMYTLLVGLAGLVFGRWIFKGPAIHPKLQMAQYAYLTMLVILAPAVMDAVTTSGAGAAFWSRALLIFLATVYGMVAVRVFDAFWPPADRQEHPAEGASPAPSA